MRRTLLISLWLMVCVPLGAQTTQRDSALAQARYLKSIYRTSGLLRSMAILILFQSVRS